MNYDKSIAQEICYSILRSRGYSPEDFYQAKEFDFSEPESQISMLHETVLQTINALQNIEYLSNLIIQESEETVPSTSGVTSAAFFSVALGEDSTFLELKDFVSHLERMGFEDSAQVHGSMFAYIDVDTPRISRIDCGECGYLDYLVEPIDHDSSLE